MNGLGAKSFLAILMIWTGLPIETAAADVPPRSPGGQTLVVPAEHLDLGDVYYVSAGPGTQLTWTADAPLMRSVATCNHVVGYFVAPFDPAEGQPPLLAGALRIPVASLRTGIADRDRELHGETALSAAEHPEITLEIIGVADPKLLGDENGRRSYTLSAACRFTVKDQALELDLPLRITLQPFTWRTMPLGMGDALILRAEFDVPRADLPTQPPRRPSPDFIPEADRLELCLLCNTMSPERNLDPEITHDAYHKQLRFITLLRDLNDPAQGYEFGRAFMKEMWDDAQALDRLAASVLDEPGIETRDLAFALRAAQRANDLTESKDPALLHTLARVYHTKGDLATALEWTRQAVEHLADAPPPLAAQVRETLQRYESQAEQPGENP